MKSIFVKRCRDCPHARNTAVKDGKGDPAMIYWYCASPKNGGQRRFFIIHNECIIDIKCPEKEEK